LREKWGKSPSSVNSREGKWPAGTEHVATADRRRTWRRHGWRLLAIWGLVLIAYSNSSQSGLVFDNSSIIGRDPRIREATSQNIGAIVAGGYRYTNHTDGLYRPVTTFTYLLNYAVFGNGTRPSGYHRVNLAIHAINVSLVYALGSVILGETAPAWALAAIWGLHPLLTESVTNIVGRADLLAAFGVLAGLLCHVMGASAAGRRKFAWLAGVAAAQAVGIFSKESAVVLPAVMLLHDLTWLDRAAWRARAPAYGALVLPIAAFFFLRTRVHPHMLVAFAENPLVNAGFWTARMTAVKVIGKLLWLFFWPFRLSVDYSYNAVPLFCWRLNWEDAKAFLALAVCLGGAVLALLLVVRGRRVGKPMLFFLVFSFVVAWPTSNLIVLIGSIMAERFLYLPSVGLAGLLVAVVVALGRRFPLPHPAAGRVAWATLGIACLALAARTYARNSDWKDEVSLWTSAVEVCPNSGKAHYNLGQALQRIPGRLDDAIAEYRAALRIDPGDAESHTNLGNALAATPGRLPEAIAEYQAALRINPGRAEPHNDLGNAMAAIPDRLPDSIAEYQAALRIQPQDAEMHYNLANALVRMPGRLPEAMAEYRAALRIDPDHADAHANLAKALSGMAGRMPDAIAEYRAALRLDPSLVNVHINLANALAGTPGGLPEAIAEYRAAVRLQPDNAAAHFDLGIALERVSGQLPAAIAEYRAALQISPGLTEAHVNLGNALAQTPGRQSEAIAEYEAALRLRPDPVVRQMMERLRTQR
jgi:tetratricopeptide (TPR) repeat protein